jgi:hypothetical protein
MTESVWAEISSVIAKDAPTAAAIVGSASPLAGLLVTLLGHAFGSPAVNTLPAVIAADVDMPIKLAEIERQVAQVDSSDRQGARLAPFSRDWIIPILAMIFILGFFSFIGLSISKSIGSDINAHQIFDVLSNATMLILSYYFGSCHSANKTK